MERQSPFDHIAATLARGLDDEERPLWRFGPSEFAFRAGRVVGNAGSGRRRIDLEFLWSVDSGRNVIVSIDEEVVVRSLSDPQDQVAEAWDPDHPGELVLLFLTYVEELLYANRADPPRRLTLSSS